MKSCFICKNVIDKSFWWYSVFSFRIEFSFQKYLFWFGTWNIYFVSWNRLTSQKLGQTVIKVKKHLLSWDVLCDLNVYLCINVLVDIKLCFDLEWQCSQRFLSIYMLKKLLDMYPWSERVIYWCALNDYPYEVIGIYCNAIKTQNFVNRWPTHTT